MTLKVAIYEPCSGGKVRSEACCINKNNNIYEHVV